jgi:hypothetical protein
MALNNLLERIACAMVLTRVMIADEIRSYVNRYSVMAINR